MQLNTDETIRVSIADRYHIRHQLGYGETSVVYAATDLRLDREVAVKVLRPRFLGTTAERRFHHEIETAVGLRHVHIMEVYDRGSVGRQPYYVMPHIDGGSLRGRLERVGRLSAPEAALITQSVASALDYAHARHVVHRDIKPENLLFDGDRVLLTDFGIAVTRQNADAWLALVGYAVGTPHYMSPEQALGEPEIDARSDVYNLACVVYEMLTGAPPFDHGSSRSIMARHVNVEPECLSTAGRDVPRGVCRVVARGLAKEPAKRFQSAGEFAACVCAEVHPRDDRIWFHETEQDCLRKVP